MINIWAVDKKLRNQGYLKLTKQMKEHILDQGIRLINEAHDHYGVAFMVTVDDIDSVSSSDDDSTSVPSLEPRD